MSFSVAAILNILLYYLPINITVLLKTLVTLQVRIHISYIKHILCSCRSKKAFLPASLTLEAALCLTLFIFASTCLILPMKIMNTERKIQAAMEEIGEDFSQYAYIKDALEKNDALSLAGADDFSKNFCKYLVSGIAQEYAKMQVISHVDTKAIKHLTMIRSQILEDGNTIDLILDYEIHLPFPVLKLSPLKRTIRCTRRAWIGKEGKNYDDSVSQNGEPDEIVYVGKNSTRYHKSRSCHYLANKLTSISVSQIDMLRNDNGGKYHPCSVCGKNANGTVFITPSGKSYHSTKNCTAIIAYARAVRLSEVKHLGPCSYCGK